MSMLVSLSETAHTPPGAQAAITPRGTAHHTVAMRYTPRAGPPGVNIRRLREAAGLSLRGLAALCDVPSDARTLDHTTIRRLERNEGYTQDSLTRIAAALTKALATHISVPDLFLPPELFDWRELPEEARARIAAGVRDALAAERYRRG